MVRHWISRSYTGKEPQAESQKSLWGWFIWAASIVDLRSFSPERALKLDPSPTKTALRQTLFLSRDCNTPQTLNLKSLHPLKPEVLPQVNREVSKSGMSRYWPRRLRAFCPSLGLRIWVKNTYRPKKHPGSSWTQEPAPVAQAQEGRNEDCDQGEDKVPCWVLQFALKGVS